MSPLDNVTISLTVTRPYVCGHATTSSLVVNLSETSLLGPLIADIPPAFPIRRSVPQKTRAVAAK
jgi:hypothetical protein